MNIPVPKYEVNDKVVIVNYGHMIGTNPNQQTDIYPNLVGRTGYIQDVDTSRGKPEYVVRGIPEKTEWYKEEQIELIEKSK